MRKPAIVVISVVIGVVLRGVCMSEPIEQMHLDKQMTLSTVHHGVNPRVVRLASNGDIIVAGSNEELGSRPWATRVSANGAVRWEFVEGETDRGDDRKIAGQGFNGVIELADHTTVLCGLRYENKSASVVLERRGLDGSLIDQRILKPSRLLTKFSCTGWNGGVGVAGSVFGQPAGTGWLAKIDEQLNLQWEKYGDDYINSDMLETAEGDLVLTSWSGNAFDLVKIGASGEILARRTLPEAEYKLVHPVSIGSAVSAVGMRTTLDTEIFHFDDKMQGPTRTMKVRNAGVKKCIELPDGSLAIFGSQFHNSATAAVTRVYKDGSSKGFLVQPPYQSGWYEDAEFIGDKYQFAAVRWVNGGQAVLDWVSFK
jgi:hypothetical protein